MDQKKIDRINTLARLAKTSRGLTQEELAERDLLRREYIAAVKENLNKKLDRTYIQRPDGTLEPLSRKKKDV